MKSAQSDEFFMKEALRLASKGRGWVNPNPMVGAVIVRNNRIIARGYHRHFGGHHAEIEALASVQGKTEGATLYANLEPCSHEGKTPPCTDAIIRAKIGRVVCAVRDPNPAAHGGIEKLRRAGISVSIGVLKNEAADLNEIFLTFHKMRRPFVALKFAASLDGKIATRSRDSKWITSETARAYTRSLRGTYQSVVVGIETILADNPHLGTRTRGLPDPLRIILDSNLRIPIEARVLRDSNVIIATTQHAPVRKKKLLQARGIRTLVFPGTRIAPRQLLESLQKMNIESILVEGGGATLGSFIDARLADKVYAFYAPMLLGGDKAVAIGGRGARRISDALRFKECSIKCLDDTVLITSSGTK